VKIHSLCLPVVTILTVGFVLTTEAAGTEAFPQLAPVGLTQNTNPQLDHGANDLWLEITAVTNHLADLTLHNTVTNQLYAILTKTNLTVSDWTGEGVVTGAVGTATSAPWATKARTDLFVWACACASGALTVDASPTPRQLAQRLVGPGVAINNVTYTGAAAARGTFGNAFCSGLPIDHGVILSCGDITNAIGPNNSSGTGMALETTGDADLSRLVGGGTTFDAAVLEFDLVSSNAFVLQFQYFFASEEYPEFVSRYNDPMAIFVSTSRAGANWINTNNTALVPGTNLPVSVSTINGGNPPYAPPTNPQYYVDNGDPDNSTSLPAFNLQYDGLTVLLTASASISAYIPHHIKIAIADQGDSVYDSAVFIKTAPQGP
jgi:hypothetical protein